MGRDCGECHVCCITLDNAELGKPENEECKHLRKHGCRIYKRRPNVCRKFVCLWKSGDLPEEARPDTVGVVAHWTTNSVAGLGINVVECEDGALERNEELFRVVVATGCSLVEGFYRDGRRRLLSSNRAWLEDLKERNPGLWLGGPGEAVDIMLGVEGK